MSELQHYGVLGMRWGIRKDRSGGGMEKVKSSSAFSNVSSSSTLEERAKKLSEESGLPLKKRTMSAEEDSKMSNSPEWSQTDKDWAMNCVKASDTWCLRRMGLDVEANSVKDHRGVGYYYSEEMKAFFSKPYPSRKRMDFKLNPFRQTSPEDIERQAQQAFTSKFPEGSFGRMNVQFTYGGAHAMTWEIRNGKVNFFNPQDPSITSKDIFEGIASRMVYPGFDTFRIDDATFDPQKLKSLCHAKG